MQTPEEIKAALDAKNSGLDPNATHSDDEAQVAKKPDADLAALLEKAKHDRKQANAEAIAAKKIAEDALARLKAIDDKDKSELQRLQEVNTAADARAKELLAQNAELVRKNLVVNARVPDQYQDAVSLMLETAQRQDKDLDVGKWFEGMKAKSPALFDINAEPVKATAGGPARHSSGLSKEMAELNAQIDAARKAGNRDLVFSLSHQKQRMEQ